MICPMCKVEFYLNHPKQVFCCRKCVWKYWNIKKGRPNFTLNTYCRNCNKLFPCKKLNYLFCVEDCRQIHKKKIDKKRARIRKLEKKLIIIKEFGGECHYCAENNIYCLHFHHLNPKDKKFQIGSAHDCSLKTLRAEAKKCMLVCANCHAKLHHDPHFVKEQAG